MSSLLKCHYERMPVYASLSTDKWCCFFVVDGTLNGKQNSANIKCNAIEFKGSKKHVVNGRFPFIGSSVRTISLL